MDSRQRDDETRFERAISEYLDSVESGNYRRNAEFVLFSWSDWIERERSVSSVETIDVLDCRRYARHLKKETQEDDGLEPSTVRTYYSIVRAFLGFCVDEEWISSNPAKPSRAVDELPDDTGDADRQFWRREQREELLSFVDQQAHDVLEGDRGRRVTVFRDRALVYVLALSGVRSGEVLSDPADEKRNGIRWSDVDLEGGTVRVFGKNREYEYAQVPEQAIEVLKRYRAVLEPFPPEFPVFPTGHRPSKFRSVRRQLREERGLSEAEVGQILDDAEDIDDVVRAYELVVPSLSKNGGRNVLERLCESTDIEVDGDVLKLHGARRGLGHELYSKGYAELAQSALRHSSIDVTHESYSDIRASEIADAVGDILNTE